MRYAIARVDDFDPTDRDRYDFSDGTKIRLDGEMCALTLKAHRATGRYPTDTGLFVRGVGLRADALAGLVGFFAEVDTPEIDEGDGTTWVLYRVNDGTDDRWWDGSAWTVAAPGEWNTLAEIQAHLATFPVTSKRARIVYNLGTADDRYSPTVRRAVLVYEVEIGSFDEEYLYRTIVRRFKTIHPEAEVVVEWPAAGATYDLDGLVLEEPLGVGPTGYTAVPAAYDLTDDPGRAVNLASAFDPSTRVVTLSAPVDAGHEVEIHVRYTPIVAVLTHPDYDEIPGVPAIVIENIVEQGLVDTEAEEAAVNVLTFEAVVVRSPRTPRLQFDVRCIAARAIDLARLTEAVKIDMAESPVVESLAVGVDLYWIGGPFSVTPQADAAHVMEARGPVRVRGAEAWAYGRRTGYGVGRVVVDLGSKTE